MRKSLFVCAMLICANIFGQTLTEKQMVNARATGYGIIAAKNPGVQFSVFVIPWDGVNTLEYNANNQINNSWHAQAVVKGNYFTQQFDGNDFTQYSSVITSQTEFDLHKSNGTQWWIICSTLPSFSSTITSNVDSGNVGIGTSIPVSKLDLGANFSNPSDFPNKIALWSSGSNNYFGFGVSAGSLDYFSQGQHRFFVGYNGSPGQEVLILKPNGNAALQGKFEAKEIKVTLTPTADFVFAEDYKLPKLEDVEKHIKENKHLPEIASANQMEKEGVNVGEFQIKLLQKIEELTLYTIEQNKQLKKQAEEIEKLKKNFKTK
jgi:hypothetical protein